MPKEAPNLKSEIRLRWTPANGVLGQASHRQAAKDKFQIPKRLTPLVLVIGNSNLGYVCGLVFEI
jgi:hypothetical protein